MFQLKPDRQEETGPCKECTVFALWFVCFLSETIKMSTKKVIQIWRTIDQRILNLCCICTTIESFSFIRSCYPNVYWSGKLWPPLNINARIS